MSKLVLLKSNIFKEIESLFKKLLLINYLEAVFKSQF